MRPEWRVTLVGLVLVGCINCNDVTCYTMKIWRGGAFDGHPRSDGVGTETRPRPSPTRVSDQERSSALAEGDGHESHAAGFATEKPQGDRMRAGRDAEGAVVGWREGGFASITPCVTVAVTIMSATP